MGVFARSLRSFFLEDFWACFSLKIWGPLVNKQKQHPNLYITKAPSSFWGLAMKGLCVVFFFSRPFVFFCDVLKTFINFSGPVSGLVKQDIMEHPDMADG